MEGALGGDGSARGIIPRSVGRLFEVRDRMIALQNWEFDLQASHLEIYNENIRDLLAAAPTSGSDSLPDFKIKHGARDGSTTVTNLTSHPVATQEDVQQLLTKAQANRSVAATNCNAQSSRSHSVFLLSVRARHPLRSDKNEMDNGVTARRRW